jgi:hypothetical protein
VDFETVSGRPTFHQAVPTALYNLKKGVKEGMFLELFGNERNWDCQATARLTDGVTHDMNIGAAESTQTAACDITDAMVKSDKLFVGENLKTLAFFLMRVGSVPDGSALSGKCERLKKALDALDSSPWMRSTQHRRDIQGLRRNLGRAFSVVGEDPVNENEGGAHAR